MKRVGHLLDYFSLDYVSKFFYKVMLLRIVTLLAYRFVSVIEWKLEYFKSSPLIFITVEADLVSSFFSQSDLQSRSPEAIFKVSDRASINRKTLMA